MVAVSATTSHAPCGPEKKNSGQLEGNLKACWQILEISQPGMDRRNSKDICQSFRALGSQGDTEQNWWLWHFQGTEIWAVSCFTDISWATPGGLFRISGPDIAVHYKCCLRKSNPNFDNFFPFFQWHWTTQFHAFLEATLQAMSIKIAEVTSSAVQCCRDVKSKFPKFPPRKPFSPKAAKSWLVPSTFTGQFISFG